MCDPGPISAVCVCYLMCVEMCVIVCVYVRDEDACVGGVCACGTLGDGCGNKAHFFWLDLTVDNIMVEGQGLDPVIYIFITFPLYRL